MIMDYGPNIRFTFRQIIIIILERFILCFILHIYRPASAHNDRRGERDGWWLNILVVPKWISDEEQWME